MNVKELINKLSGLNPELPVVIEYYDEDFDYYRYDEIKSTFELVVSKYPENSCFDFHGTTEDSDPTAEQVSVVLLHIYAESRVSGL